METFKPIIVILGLIGVPTAFAWFVVYVLERWS